MSLSTYTPNLGAYGNVKTNVVADRMAKNRWGSKFKRLYNPLKDVDNKAVFTQGMVNCVGTDVLGTVEELELLRAGLNGFFTLSDDSYAKVNSYFTLLCSPSGYGEAFISDVMLSLSLPVVTSATDARRVSKFFQKGSNTSASVAYLEPIDSYFKRRELVDNSTQKPFYSKNQLSLFTEDGTVYGHVEGASILKNGTNFSNILDTYGVENGHALFLSNYDYEIRFLNLFSALNLNFWLSKFVDYSASWKENEPYSGNISIVFGVDLIIAWIDENLASWYAYVDKLDVTRGGIELKLIKHLNVCEILQEQIGAHAGDIASIWFEFKKTVSPTLVDSIDANGQVVQVFDPAYEWWLEEQFDDIRKAFKNFHLFCDLIITTIDDEGASGGGYQLAHVTIKDEALALAGWKVYWLVSALLNIDVRNKKRSFLERIFSIALLVIAIYLTAISGNPAWIKIALIGASLLSFSGALSPKAQLILAVITFAYGLSSTNFSAMSNYQMFNWAISNVEMVFKMVQMYDAIKLDDKEDAEELAPSEIQEQSMKFLYEDAYNQYDNVYSVMYDFEPNYK